MPSPFPGMNPYLEQSAVWHDFHERFLPLAAEVLGAQVLPRYFIKIDEHIYVHELAEESRRLAGRADPSVARLVPTPGPPTVGTELLAAPAEVTAAHIDVQSLSYLEVYDRESRQVVTVVELLSPTNKYAGPDRELYLAKCRQILWRNVHLVEIDLLRGGPRMPWQGMPECDYCVVVSRAGQWPRAGLWPIRLRERLPEIPIPLRAPDPDARLDLQHLLHRVYDAAGYAYYIYTGQPEPPLSAEDAAWARSFVPVPVA
ncbi:MAG TPA: DUF4058 family protein [Gemmataceae bacterium]|nr:DUF4058 family protein [Gemmataceae bacterium]